jgi:pimeloyl-ACP methyl ester carboxylesterase
METLPTLVLVPGLACDHRVWSPLLPALQGLARPWVPAWQVETDLGEVAERLLRTVESPRFLLAGHSLGGRVALEVLRRAPQRLLGLALLDTGCHPRAAGEAGETEARKRLDLVDLARREGMRAMGERWAPGMLHPARLGGPVHDAVLDMVQDQPVDTFAAQQQALIHRPDATELLAGVRCPSLLLCGREDAWSPLSQHQAMAEHLPGARLVAVPDCGHMSTLEQPEAVAQALVDWLRDC